MASGTWRRSVHALEANACVWREGLAICGKVCGFWIAVVSCQTKYTFFSHNISFVYCCLRVAISAFVWSILPVTPSFRDVDGSKREVIWQGCRVFVKLSQNQTRYGPRCDCF